MSSIFTKIINGEIPSYKIAENDKFYAFLDIAPLTKGHALVIPKIQTDYIFDLDDNTLAEMAVFAKKVALAIEKNVECKRIGTAVLGLDVPHAHIHLIPIVKGDEINFQKERINLTKDEFSALANHILNTFGQNL
ncbi:HIT domain-containing protein [Bacteroidales bacterium OttesenSCG-928-B11]|nr:HIT domain-containing protein [Bacteroidales bacterium OttesenSCG-928-B11]MDL2325744.1 HIT domain-containing protein [Bacteroidales bacterium OttesenSCG-928-A14]